ncbi:MAG: 3-phosphoshikimate 1-carboxyvinyltransferase [Anaerolineae bacterium]|nr:3-phosphoshikimate 1-carboxyvinyltransferase [Anaerolineae bacterium]
MHITVRSGGPLSGTASVPGDKSISHRALILGALADGTSEIRGFLPAGDTLATLDCIRKLGIQVEQPDLTTLVINGKGLYGLCPPDLPLDCKNAGTAMRLLAGVLAGQSYSCVLDGSPQLRRRPMARIVDPLREMGARIECADGRAPLYIYGSPLRGVMYEMPVASAQVKSCLLLAGLYATGHTTVIEPGPARDHTERLLLAMDAAVSVDHPRITVEPGGVLRPLDLTVPGDVSSAAFLLVAVLVAAREAIQLAGIGVNPTRTGILDILARMGADIQVTNLSYEAGEPVADLTVYPAGLQGARIGGDLIVRAIDEFPVLMVAATQAAGETRVSGAQELRVKETDRIAVMTAELRKLGAAIDEQPDGFVIVGPQRLAGAVVDGHGDHRVAMSLVLAGLCAEGETTVKNAACIDDSFPGFVEMLQTLGAEVEQNGE